MYRSQPTPGAGSRRGPDLRWLVTGEFWGALLGACSLLGIAALLSLLGTPGRAIARNLRSLAGWGAYPLVLLGLAAGAWLLLRHRFGLFRVRAKQVVGLELLALGCLGLLHLPLTIPEGMLAAANGSHGGYLGWSVVYALRPIAGRVGSVILLLALAVAGAALAFDITWTLLRDTVMPLLEGLASRLAATPPDDELQLPEDDEPPAEENAEPVVTAPRRTAARPPSPTRPRPEPERPARRKARNPRLPSLDLLAPSVDRVEDDAAIRDQKQIIEETLAHFGVPAQVVDVQHGPTVTQFGIEPGYIERKGQHGTVEQRKVRVSRIVGLANDLALALSAPTIRIEAPVPGKPLVGIEVPNRRVSMVNLRSVLESDAFQRIRSPLRIALGQDVSGQPIAADLARMPHLLIAGATGSGKSVCINTLIACLLLENTPEDLQLVLIDPKRVELGGFNGVPHLVAPVIIEPDEVVLALRWLTQEMDRRYKLLSQHKARNLQAYNAGPGKRADQHLPNMVVFVDELADLMMVAAEEVERSICRLAQMARAVGIHLVIATQRPSVDVVTGLIKANFPARVAFAVSSQIDSRVILDAAGAETLLGRGDMLFMSPEAGHLVRLQGCFVSDDELSAIAEYWRQVEREAQAAQAGEPAPEGAPLVELPPPAAPWEGMLLEGDAGDSLLGQAIELIRGQQQASTSYLQRRLRIGYARAARLMQQLEERGLVGPDQGGGRAREVYAEAEASGDGGGEEP